MLGSVSVGKLQRLCYYSQAWNIVWTGDPIFAEDFYAWRTGVVCNELYKHLEGVLTVVVSNLENGNSYNLTYDQKCSIDVVLRHYGSMESYYLAELARLERPWQETWKKFNGDPLKSRCSVDVIPKVLMAEYYGQLCENKCGQKRTGWFHKSYSTEKSLQDTFEAIPQKCVEVNT